MPPHCDALDGPVVKAARRALEEENVELALPYVKADGEDEVRAAYALSVVARRHPEAREVADRHFFETVVRVHRRGERAPYTGLKPAGLDVGEVIPAAERAIESGSPEELAALLTGRLEHEIKHRLDEVLALRSHERGPVPEARGYVEAMLGLQVWAHKVSLAIAAPAHEGGEHRHELGPGGQA